MENRKKVAAAMAAVINYIKTGEETAGIYGEAVETGLPASLQSEPMKLWGINGRQTMMQTRNLMQMRAFHGARLR